ncbi:Rhodanese-like protein [Macrophomina phaseolina MS6]|uniref:Rhodanese-like protein n=1 Tax=Macrophomina phaseolina (strain MS6) TaxID=1126212 RepID=K2RN51_MACPH|nr:Rhodanese-like protein [Macrophomina phaseolina MS6]
MSVPIEVWVKTRTNEIWKTGAVSKDALKKTLINERPGDELQIRQIINITKSNSKVPPPAQCNQQKKSPEKCATKITAKSKTKSESSYAQVNKPCMETQAGQDPPSKKTPKKGSCSTAIQKIPIRANVPDISQQSVLLEKRSTAASIPTSPDFEEVRNAVLCCPPTIKDSNQAIPQYSLLGSRIDGHGETGQDPRIFLNTNVPFSAFVCGLQGSGKSHTVSCMIENFLIPFPMLGVLHRPLSALAFHYAEHTSSSTFRPSELAACLSIELPFLEDLIFQDPRCVPLMSVNQDQTPPLYISQVTNILRQMSATGTGEFEYASFRQRLRDAEFDRKQRAYLDQRLDLLESFLDLSGKSRQPEFTGGQLTVIDLSCPFMDDNTACVLFRAAMSMFLDSEGSPGKVIVVDEAHKFMRDTPAAKDLTEALLSPQFRRS